VFWQRSLLSSSNTPPSPPPTHPPPSPQTTKQRYALPKARGIFRELPSPSPTTTRDIIRRIVDNRAAFEARNAKKAASEEKYYAAKGAGPGSGGAEFVKEV
jgi:ethanolamine-phosphate cytidylyltransferase